MTRPVLRASAFGAIPSTTVTMTEDANADKGNAAINFASALQEARSCANSVVTTRHPPVVTTRKLPQSPWAAHGLQQVTAPSDALTARPKTQTVQRDLPRPATRGPHQPRRRLARPEPWDKGSPDEPTCSSKRRRCQCRVPRRPDRRPRHKTGVVSRVPCSSRNAEAFGTDRNTYLTSTHHRQQTATQGQSTTQRKEEWTWSRASPRHIDCRMRRHGHSASCNSQSTSASRLS